MAWLVEEEEMQASPSSDILPLNDVHVSNSNAISVKLYIYFIVIVSRLSIVCMYMNEEVSDIAGIMLHM